MKRLFNSITKSTNSTSKCEQENDSSKFYIPTTETLQRIKHKQEVDLLEIKDYTKYICKNYYYKEDENLDFEVFCAEWLKYSDDIKAVEQRKEKAMINIITALGNNESIYKVDAFWISDRIYIDCENPMLRRRILKVNQGDKIQLEVETHGANNNVGKEIDMLRSQLKQIFFNIDERKV